MTNLQEFKGWIEFYLNDQKVGIKLEVQIKIKAGNNSNFQQPHSFYRPIPTSFTNLVFGFCFADDSRGKVP